WHAGAGPPVRPPAAAAGPPRRRRDRDRRLRRPGRGELRLHLPDPHRRPADLSAVAGTDVDPRLDLTRRPIDAVRREEFPRPTVRLRICDIVFADAANRPGRV